MCPKKKIGTEQQKKEWLWVGYHSPAKKTSVNSSLPDLLKYSVVSGLLANLLIHS